MKFFCAVLFSLLLVSCSIHRNHNHDHNHDHGHHEFQPKFSQFGKGDRLPFSPGHDNIFHIKNGDLPVPISLVEVILAPKSLGAPPHVHSNEDEVFIVLEGTVHFLNGKEEVVAKKGTIASLPRGHFHGFWNPTKKPAKMALIIAPGHFEKFFYAVEKAVKETKPKTPAEVGKIISELAAQEGVTIDMSKLPPSGLKLLPPPPKK